MSYKMYFPFNTYRKYQEKILERIEASYNVGKKIILLSAATGIGKSAIALAIAKFYGSAHIITTQKTLQAQYHRDFPEMFSMQGKGNYMCAQATDLTCSRGVCRTQKDIYCAEKASKYVFCPYYIALGEAKKRPIVVHNFASFLYQTKYGKHFGQRDIMIIDESHRVEQTLMDFISFRITASSTGYVIQLRKHLSEYIDLFNNILSELIVKLQNIEKGKGNPADQDEIEDIEKMIEKLSFFLSQAKGNLDNWVFNYEAHEDGKTLKWIEIKPVYIKDYAKPFLLDYGKKVLCMSATLNKEIFCSSLGLSENDVEYFNVPSPFPKENRPIYRNYIGTINNKNLDEMLPVMTRKIEKIINMYPNDKGIIHTHTYRIAGYLRDNLRNDRLIFHFHGDNGMTRSRALNHHIESKEPTIIVTPSMEEGIDLKDDLARFQVICKTPFAFLGDKQIKARMKNDLRWYQWQAMLTICQASGRAVRCLSRDTEVLTENGWKGCYELLSGDVVYGVDLERMVNKKPIINNNVRLKKHKVIDIHFQENQNVVNIKGKGIDVIVTPDHNMLIQKNVFKKYGYSKYYKLKSSPIHKVMVKNLPSKYKLFGAGYISGRKGKKASRIPIDYFWLLGIILSDGHISKSKNQIRIFQSKTNADIIEKINNILLQLKIEFKKYLVARKGSIGIDNTKRKSNIYSFDINGFGATNIRELFMHGMRRRHSKIRKYKKRYPAQILKEIPLWIFKKASSTQMKKLLEGLIDGDGTRVNLKSWTYYSSNKKLIDGVQAICSLVGYRTNLIVRRKDSFELNIHTNAACILTRYNIHEIENQDTWCPQTELGSIVIRRNGRVCIIGNSETDTADTFLLDRSVERLLTDYRDMFPAWFLEALV